MMPHAFIHRSENLEPHRDAFALRRACELLREELVKLITERDYLTTLLPVIEADYNLKIGYLEYETFMLECDARRARRRLELTRSYANRNLHAPLEIIESELDSEFQQWQAKIDQMRSDMDFARQVEAAPRLSMEETRELQTLYRALAKRLHPDLDPHQTARERNLWLRVADAYRDGALDELHTLALLLEGENTIDEITEAGTSIIETLAKRQADLRERIHQILARLAEIKTTLPFILQDRANDAAWLTTRKLELATQNKTSLLQREQLDEAYRLLTGAKINRDSDNITTSSASDDDTDWAEILEEIDGTEGNEHR